MIKWLVLVALLVGCAQKPLTAQVGRVADGQYLATIHVRAIEQVRELCLSQVALACAQVLELPDDKMGAVLTFPFPPGWTPNMRDVYVSAHELCHVVARLQKLPDPCHDQDEGKVPKELMRGD